MALVTCPHCKKTVSSTSGKCPNCGRSLSCSAFDKNAPRHARLHMLSNVLLTASFLLLLLEFIGSMKTYAGGILLGAGFLFHALSLLEKEKDKDYDGKRRGRLVLWISVALILAGFLFLYMEL